MNLLKEYTRNKDFYGFKRLQEQINPEMLKKM